MLAAVTQLIGGNLRLQHCKLNWKPPTKGTGEVDWHQDFPFLPHTNYDVLACHAPDGAILRRKTAVCG